MNFAQEIFMMKTGKYSMEPATLALPDPERYSSRWFQGIPGIEILPDGRIVVCCYGNTLQGEGPGNYVILLISSDNGNSWHEILNILPPDEISRTYDPVVWLAPDKKLWLFYAQCTSSGLWDCFDGKAGVWCVICDDPSEETLHWSSPVRLCDGVMMNKPTVLSDSSWAFPVALWACYPEKLSEELREKARPNILISYDRGKSFELRIGPDIPERTFDENVIVEKSDGTLWMLARTSYGSGESFSSDGGKSWSIPADSHLGGPESRFALRRLKSGKLCLINHQSLHQLPGEKFSQVRNKLAAWLSDDDGKSWYGRLLIDARDKVSYPDFTEDDNGAIYAVYDYNRLETGQIMMAKFTEADIAAGEFITPGSFTGKVVAALLPKKQRKNKADNSDKKQ